MHKVLVLGAGLVSSPIVRYFLDRPDCSLTVATMFRKDAESLIDGHPRGRAVALDVSDGEALASAISVADLVVSLVPFHLHATVAKVAIEHRVHLVTTSYVSPEMRALDDAAKEAGVMLLNECGLDPGLDHMSAMHVIDQVHARGGRVLGFESCTGGLPAPDSCTNPWNYKFSWSPRGALVAGTYAARFMRDGEVVEIPGPELFANQREYEVDTLGTFESYPNRDSLPYQEKYGLNSVRNMLRGTIRYPGWSRTMKKMSDRGYFSLEPREFAAGMTLADLSAELCGVRPTSGDELRNAVADSMQLAADDDVLVRMSWAGLFEATPLSESAATTLDQLATVFEHQLQYAPGERDMVVMQHRFDVETAEGEREVHHSQLICYGDRDGTTATSRTVSWPAAIASSLVLDGKLALRGVQIPTKKEIYGPILGQLEPLGIAFREWIGSAPKDE